MNNVSQLDPVEFAKALADDTRQQIMRLLCCRELPVNEVVAELSAAGRDVTQPTVSHHLAILRAAHLVRTRRDGQQTYYTLNQDQVAICCGEILLRLAPLTAAAERLQPITLVEEA
jgi:DNA-binding transcriptional ArsR family regulator